MGVDISTPGPFRWRLCSSERSLTAMSYVPGASWVTAFPLASRSEMTNASFVPTTATSFGLSAWATAAGSTRAVSSVTRAIRVVMTGLYGSLGRSDFAKREPRGDQDHAEQGDQPERLAGERQRRGMADLLGGRPGAALRPPGSVALRRQRAGLRLRRLLLARCGRRGRRRHLGRRRHRPRSRIRVRCRD